MTTPTTRDVIEPGSLVAVAGATGYIGARLVPRLAAAGFRVRCLARTPKKLRDRPWRNDPNIEVVACDLTDRDRTAAPLAGCDAAFYLVHAMDQGQGYAERDRDTAASFAAAATTAGVARIIYLGGLGSDADVLSAHLESRREVERLLASGSARVTALRAAMIIGAGSASFEILRYQGIAVRAGDMAALPLLKRFGTAEAVRASAYVYSTTADLDRLADAITSM